MPIRARIDMLSTGIRTPIGIKVFGPDLAKIVEINDQLERTLRTLPNTRSVYAEREMGGFFIDVTPDREAIARYGLTVAEVLDVVESSIGGMNVSQTYEGRERYQIGVRYPRELRDDVEKLKSVLVPIAPLTPRALPTGNAGVDTSMDSPAPMIGARGGGMGMGGGTGMTSPSMDIGPSAIRPRQSTTEPTAAFVPLGQLAKIETVMGPPMIKSEQGSLCGWVYVDIDTSDVGGYVDAAKEKVAREVSIPAGYYLKWTGQYELLERVQTRMSWILPLTLVLVFAILYINFRGAAQSLIVMTGVPFAAVGAVWMLWAFGFNTSIAVWVGMIALLGVAAETASVMVVYRRSVASRTGRRNDRDEAGSRRARARCRDQTGSSVVDDGAGQRVRAASDPVRRRRRSRPREAHRAADVGWPGVAHAAHLVRRTRRVRRVAWRPVAAGRRRELGNLAGGRDE
jgi:Cu(I)/Ag(I) efflux system membrane protein CusA/SilA